MTIDIAEPMTELCNKLGLDPSNVAEIIFRPNHVTVTVFKLDANGSKYLEDAKHAHKGAARETQTFKVTT